MLFTAADAYMRDLHVIVPSDCVTALTPAAHRAADAQINVTGKLGKCILEVQLWR